MNTDISNKVLLFMVYFISGLGADERVFQFLDLQNIDKKFICLERALDTTKKYNLRHYMGDKFVAF